VVLDALGANGLDALKSARERGSQVNDVDVEELGPIDYLMVEFPPDRKPDGSALMHLRDLVERNIIRVLDLAFVRKEADGSMVGIEIADLDFDGDIDVALLAEAKSGLMDQSDLEEAGGALEAGRSAAVLVYENRWAAPLATMLRRSGAQLVATGRIPVQGILAALDALEAQS
jgi:hypothetical protein